MEYTTMVLEEEDELLSVEHRVTNPLLGLPVPSYIVVARVTTVTQDQETATTLQTGHADDGQDP
jgi:hypothetical protein